MGIIHSAPKIEDYSDSYHIFDTFANHNEWKHTVKRMNHTGVYPFHRERVNVPDLFGSQPYIIYAIHDIHTKDQIEKAAYSQPQLSACNCVFVFCARTDFNLITDIDLPYQPTPSILHRYVSRFWNSYYKTRIAWAIRQTYMAIGFVIAACAEESIPCYPIDTFNESDMISLLDLPSHIIPISILTIGALD
jgi:nitroreductase